MDHTVYIFAWTWNFWILNYEFWRIRTGFHYLLIQTQIAKMNLMTWFPKWQISINIWKTDYIIFYNKNKLQPPPSIPVTIDENFLANLKGKRVLSVITDEDPFFTTHIEHITKKWKIPHSTLTLYPAFSHHVALYLCKVFIRFGCALWDFSINNAKHLKVFDSAQRGATSPFQE